MSGCVCQGLGAYVDGDGHSDLLQVEACEAHPLPVGEGESAPAVAGLRVDQCLDAIAKVRDLLWPDRNPEAPWPSDCIEEVARALEFLRPGPTRAAGAAAAPARPAAQTTVTVTLDSIVARHVDVELPTSCPHCGLSFEESDSLLEEGYCATNQRCSIATYEGGGVIDGYMETEDVYDGGLVTGYQCGGCRTTLVSTEGPGRDGRHEGRGVAPWPRRQLVVVATEIVQIPPDDASLATQVLARGTMQLSAGQGVIWGHPC